MRLCKGVQHVESFRVEIVFPKTFTEMVFERLWYFYRGPLCCILCFTVLFVIIGVYPLLLACCYLAPEIELQGDRSQHDCEYSNSHYDHFWTTD